MNELTTVFQDDLVILRRNRAFTDSLKVAKGTKNTHHAIQQMIKKYEPALERWGNVEFSHSKCENPKGGRPVKVFFLNEPQATFLISLLDNNEIVVQFKSELVDRFYKMRELLFEKQSDAWKQARIAGKLTRHSETDTIKKLVEYAKDQGSEHADMLYIVYSRLADKMAGINKRDLSNTKQLNTLDEVENMIIHVVELGMSQDKQYKAIFQDCKQRLEWWQDCTFRLLQESANLVKKK